MRGGIDLEREDYVWVTRKIMEVANVCADGRVVSCLEGGYGVPAKVQAGVRGCREGVGRGGSKCGQNSQPCRGAFFVA
jgi:acetoin utilization deacetylase AcuC-like enzyme